MDPQDPNFEKKNKGEYDCHHLHLHFRQKSIDTIANTNILLSAKRYWDYVTTVLVLKTTSQEEGAEEAQS